jgi:hypothetical protein
MDTTKLSFISKKANLVHFHWYCAVSILHYILNPSKRLVELGFLDIV